MENVNLETMDDIVLKYTNNQKLTDYISENLINEKTLKKTLYFGNKDEELERILALCVFLEIDEEKIKNLKCLGGNTFEYEKERYLVLTDNEANKAHQDYLYDLIDGMGGFCEFVRGDNYYEIERKENGDLVVSKSVYVHRGERAGALAVDGKENEIKIYETSFFIYKQN